MIDPKLLDDLSKKMAAHVPAGLQAMQEDLQKNFRSVLESGLTRLNLVTREEFEIQSEVLAKTRARLEQMEKQLSELEARLNE